MLLNGERGGERGTPGATPRSIGTYTATAIDVDSFRGWLSSRNYPTILEGLDGRRTVRSPSPGSAVASRGRVAAAENATTDGVSGCPPDRAARSGYVDPRPGREFTVEVTGFFTAIVIGLVIGALGRLVVPGRQSIPLWLTLLIGVVAAVLGTLVAGALDVDDTRGIDWIELALQVAFAAVGVSLVSGAYRRR